MNNREHIDNLLIEVYMQDEKKIKQMNDIEAKKLLHKLQKDAVKRNKNPNSFFVIKELPAPKVWETKTTSKGGWLVMAAFVLLMLSFLGLFLGFAFLR